MFREMRRNKQVLSKEAAEKILREGDFGVLALSGDDGYCYAVPINYAVEGNKIYFHSAKTGHKLDAIRNNDKVSFCVVDRHEVIAEEFTRRKLSPKSSPGIICHSHGPFTWGKDAAQAVYHAVVLEELAKMALYTVMIDPQAAQAPQYVQDKHYLRKHGPNAYYGQR